MAKAAAAAASKSPKAPTAGTVELGQAGIFTFSKRTGVSVPEDAGRVGGFAANPLPFKAWFGELAHNDATFIPEAFWTGKREEGGRGADLTKMKPSVAGYQKSKIRDAFNAWKKQEGKEAERANRSVILVYRKVGDTDSTGFEFKEAGMDCFMQIEQPAKPAKK
jgi:hypothetical protein